MALKATRKAAANAPAKAIPEEHRPYIPAAQVLPELTVKVFVVGILLSWIMAAANAYLGLFAALTVSAAIPASVVSMAVLRFFKRRNILENNLIQTTASAGESVTAGIIFTLPALLFLGVWQEIGIVETIVIAALGGSLGVLFTIPLRRAFIVDAKLQYPEGVATVEVLKSGEKGGAGIGYIVLAGGLGAAYKLMSGGLGLWRESADFARRVGSSGFYLGGTLSPALLAVGFIVGLPIAVLIFLGGFIAYGVAIPAYLATHAWPTDAGGAELSALDAFGAIRGAYVRYIGVGAMATGGVWTLLRLRSALKRGFESGLDAYRAMQRRGEDTRIRTERDINMRTVLVTMGAFVVPLTVLFTYFVTDAFADPGRIWVGIVLGIVMTFAAFLFSAVGGYMAGVVGSSNNPISGTAIGTILVTALLLLVLGVPSEVGMAATILIGSTIAAAAAIAGDNMQDLKAGHLLGGTPRNLQIMQMVGAIAAAFVIPFILMLLHSAYTIGSEKLAAPQANLMASIAQGIFGTGIPWDFFLIGVGVAVATIVADQVLERRQAAFRMPVLAVAVGIYLPFDLATPIFLGGLVAYFAKRKVLAVFDGDAGLAAPEARARYSERRLSRGVLFSSGLIAGESLMGILLAGAIVATGNTGPLAFFSPTAYWAGLILLLYLAYLLGYVVTRRTGVEG